MSTLAEEDAGAVAERRGLRRVLLLAGPVVLVAAALWFYLHGGRIVSSDNAYVHADKLTVSTEVAGAVKEVAVQENQHVAAGQLLFRLDDEPYRIAVAAARAQLEAVRLELATLRGTYGQRLAEIEEAKEAAAFAESELHRQETLTQTEVSPTAQLDQARHARDAANRRVAVLQQEAATVLASLGGLDVAEEQNPRFQAAQAQLDRAERDLRKTRVVAPIDGVVANVTNIPVGKFLQPAQPAFVLVATDRVWIEANLKETELTYLKAGDAVSIEIDSYPHRRWTGAVTDIGPATGAEFAVIPPQNASGNWVKTVQRIPVRIAIDRGDSERPLRAGMSAQVEIDTRHQRHLRDLARLVGMTGRNS